MVRKRNKIQWDVGKADPIGDIRRGIAIMKRKSNIIPIPYEHEEQVALFKYAALMAKQTSEWGLLFAIPSGGGKEYNDYKSLKDEGVKSGVPDIFMAVARKGFHGLFLEIKRQKGGRVSDTQKEWIEKLKEQGYKVHISRGFETAKIIIQWYLSKDRL